MSGVDTLDSNEMSYFWRTYMKKIVGMIAVIAVLSFSLPVLSQDKGDKQKPEKDKQQTEETGKEADKGEKDPSKLYVDLSALIYMDWAYFSGFKYTGTTQWGKVARWGYLDDNFLITGNPYTIIPVQPYNYSKKNDNTFRLQRCYLTIKKRIGELFSVKITTDIDPTSSDILYLKYGFIQFLKEFPTPVGPVSLKLQMGKIATPVIGITDNLSDLRWIGPNYLNNSKLVLNGHCFDDSADLGGMFSLNLFKFATLEYTITNGEGVKSDGNETYAGKAHTLLVSINPTSYIKELYVNFYGRWEDTNKRKTTMTSDLTIVNTGVEGRSYYGVGAAWSSDLIKLGVNFFMPQMQYTRTSWINYNTLDIYKTAFATGNFTSPMSSYSAGHIVKFYLVDSWFNLNLGAVTPAGVLLLGRCAWGRELPTFAGNLGQTRETLVLGGGAGYQFSQYFRMVLYYETVRYRMTAYIKSFSKKDPTPNNNVYVKAEIKF